MKIQGHSPFIKVLISFLFPLPTLGVWCLLNLIRGMMRAVGSWMLMNMSHLDWILKRWSWQVLVLFCFPKLCRFFILGTLSTCKIYDQIECKIQSTSSGTHLFCTPESHPIWILPQTLNYLIWWLSLLDQVTSFNEFNFFIHAGKGSWAN